LNNLAWIFANQKDEKFRNGPEAVRLASRAADLTSQKHYAALDTLSAAYAEAGRFPEAVETAKKALDLASASGQTNLSAEIQKRLQLYEAGRAYREP